MSLYEIFSHTDRFHYRTNLFSLATCFLILCTALTFLPPFLFTYFAGGFWIKENTYSEQPHVNYSKYILMTSTGSDTATGYFSSSYASLNAAYRNILLMGINTCSGIDSNSDGNIDQFSFVFQLLFPVTTASVSNVDIWLLFQYELRARQYINMETMALISLNLPSSMTLSMNPKVTTVGELIFEQRQPIQSSGSDTTYNKSIIDPDTLFASSSLDFNTILDGYFTRKYYTTYQTQNVKWEAGETSGNTMLTVNITINTGRQTIRFIPGFWQEFKWGWIQYVCVLVPFIMIFNRIKEFVFRNRLVRTLVEGPHHRYKA